MRQKKISIIIPVYKSERFLRRCLDSVVNQTYKNLEIILVDDGSPDDCGIICDEYAEKDSRILVIHKENGGVSSARNVGLKAASGEWIGWVDSDDWIEPDMYEYLIGLTEKFSADVAQCGTVLEKGRERELYGPSKEIILSDNVPEWIFCSNNVWDKLYATHLVEGICFDEDVLVAEDLLFNLQVLQRSWNVVLGEKVKYHYNILMTSLCRCAPSLESLTSAQTVYQYAVQLYENKPDVRQYFWTEMFRNQLDTCSKIVRFYRPEFEDVKKKIRGNIRQNIREILNSRRFSRQERVKFILIAWSWLLYRALVMTSWQATKREWTIDEG